MIGFGARKLNDAEEGPKYLNTPESPLYKKSEVLYGVDLAKREISKRSQAVIVEGYTDVMACHLAGVPTAVATCGTAFGAEHIKVLRRLLLDQSGSQGEVVFTFDGDAAGQKAALRAFADEQKFVTQTYVAVQPSGLDPCDLRVGHGDAAVRDLIASKEPLFAFAIRSVISRYDVSTNEGRLSALDAAAPIVAASRTGRCASCTPWTWTAGSGSTTSGSSWSGSPRSPARPPARPSPPAPAGRRAHRSRGPHRGRDPQARRAAPGAARGAVRRDRDRGVHPPRARRPLQADLRGGRRRDGRGRRARVGGPPGRRRGRGPAGMVTRFAVEELRVDLATEERYAAAMLAALELVSVNRAIEQLKSRLERAGASESPRSTTACSPSCSNWNGSGAR
nr:hypothetical protein GCM10020093_107370 [Planobispora longispora]